MSRAVTEGGHCHFSDIESLHPKEAKAAQEILLQRDIGSCEEGTGKLSKDGHFWSNQRRNRFKHDDVFENAFGALDYNVYIVHHVCCNKTCLNPAHLVALTRRFHSQLHGYGAENGNHSDSALQAKVAYAACRLHVDKYANIALVVGLSLSKVKLVASSRTWQSETANIDEAEANVLLAVYRVWEAK